MKMAYIATNPDFISDAAEEIAQWKKDGATIELLPRNEALKRFSEKLPQEDGQIEMSEKHID